MDIVANLFTLWVIIAGIAMVLKGPDGAKAVAFWPLRTITRLARNLAGEALMRIGKLIKGP